MGILGFRTVAQRLGMAIVLVAVLLGSFPPPAIAQVADAVIEVLVDEPTRACCQG